MANVINYAERFQEELDQAIAQNTLTNALETPNVNWLGARTFHVPHLEVSGYKNHSRAGGFNRGTVEVTHDPYTLQLDRDRKSTRLNSSHVAISFAVFCLKKQK